MVKIMKDGGSVSLTFDLMGEEGDEGALETKLERTRGNVDEDDED
jgi:hypothetical protein